jgi:glycosyltransferase involved in cell wall biosynthesis
MNGKHAQVAMICEGTYPYVSGGVSQWIHEIVTSMPDVSFRIVFIGGDRSSYGEPRYQVPPNVVEVEEHFIMESRHRIKARTGGENPEAFADVTKLHNWLRGRLQKAEPGVMDRIFKNTGKPKYLTREHFLFSKYAWLEISSRYAKYCTDPSFLDYFWTVRTIHEPLFRLSAAALKGPRGDIVHSISTGYAGYFGFLLSKIYGSPYVLTEHGIYTKERKLDLAQAEWIKDPQEVFFSGIDEEMGYVRRLWIRFFEGLGRLAYGQAGVIVSLMESNRLRQVRDGADAAKTRIIPNGIDVARFAPLRSDKKPGRPPVIGFIGRVVPIKDLKTFLRSARVVLDQIPAAKFLIIGPDAEDQEYARECRMLAATLGVENSVEFTGMMKTEGALARLDLLALTSVSEGLPLVILEAFAAGIPVVSTDVGACRELIEGRAPQDREIGPSGLVAQIADPSAIGAAMVMILNNAALYRAMSASAIRRASALYDRAEMIASYRSLYLEAQLWQG